MSHQTLLAAMATLCTLREVHAAPKPGLVDRTNSGAHRDMNFETFFKSTLAIAPGWKDQARTGLTGIPPELALRTLRRTGLKMERAMFAVTGGVNTHKGLIFALSFLVYASGFTLAANEPAQPETLARIAAATLGNCLERELHPLRTGRPARPLTHGERLFLEHGITGIRGEVQQGFPSVLEAGLPAFRRCLDAELCMEDCALEALLALMERCEDSNVIHRMGFDYWQGPYREQAGSIRHETRPGSTLRRDKLKKLDQLFSETGVSPGGAADLLTCTLFLQTLEKWSKKQNTSWQQGPFPIYF